MMVNVAYFAILSPLEIINSKGVALLSIQTLFKPISPLISAFVALTSIGALNASIMGHSRKQENKQLYEQITYGKNDGMSHLVTSKKCFLSIIVILGWGLTMLFSGGVTDMMEFISLFSTIMVTACMLSLLYLRFKNSNEHRPYKIFTPIPVIQLLVNIAMLFLVIYQKPKKMGIILAILFAGIPVYLFGVVWKNKPKILTSLLRNTTILAQKTLNIKTTVS